MAEMGHKQVLQFQVKTGELKQYGFPAGEAGLENCQRSIAVFILRPVRNKSI